MHSRKKISKLIWIVVILWVQSCALKSHEDVKRIPYFGVEDKSVDKKVHVEGQIATLEKKKSQQAQTYAVYVSSGDFSVSLSLGAFRYFEMEKRSINYVTGHGLGAVVAFLYALKGQSNLAEWEWFKLAESMKGLSPSSKEWLRTLELYLEDNYKDIAFHDLKIPLVLTYQTKNNKVVSINKGKVLGKLKQVLAINTKALSDHKLLSVQYFRNIKIDQLLILDNTYKSNDKKVLSLNKDVNNSFIKYLPLNDKQKSEQSSQALGLVNIGFSKTKKLINDTISEN